MQMKLLATVAAAAVSLGMATVASATVVYTAPVTLLFGPNQTDFSQNLSFAQYNPADHDGHALNSVHIDLSGTAFADATTINCVTGDGNGICQGSFSSQILMQLSAPGPTNLLATLPLNTFPYLLNQGDSIVVPAQSNTDNDSIEYCAAFEPNCTNFNAAIVALFSGVGNILLTLNADGSTNLNQQTGGAFQFPNPSLTGDGSATIYYDYVVQDTVPEPMTLGILGLGLAGLGLARRRRS